LSGAWSNLQSWQEENPYLLARFSDSACPIFQVRDMVQIVPATFKPRGFPELPENPGEQFRASRLDRDTTAGGSLQ